MTNPIDYQGNTRKSREKKEKPEKVIVEKVVIGEVIQKPKGVWHKFKEVFLGGDAKQTARFVLADVFFPAMRNLLFDIVTEGARRQIFGESTYRRRGPTNYQSSYQYNNPTRYSQNPIDPRTQYPRAGLSVPRVQQNRHDMNDIILGTKEEAELVIERLSDILNQYDVASLADLNDLLGVETSYIDNKWGWTYLNNAQVRQIRQGYLLELPPLEEI
jgi:hypothetical protein